MAGLLRNTVAVESSSLLQSPHPGRGKPSASSLTYDAVNTGTFSSTDTIDDAVSVGVRKLRTTFISCVSLWLVSYVMVMLQVIDKGHFVAYTALLFVPMWVGSIYGFVSIVRILMGVCKNGSTLVSNERRLFLQAQGEELEQYINFESLPLMRRLFFWSSVFATFLLLSFTTQIFFYLWLIAGVIGMWHAFYPVLFVSVLLQLYLFLVKTLSLFTCCCFALSFAGLLLYAAKCKSELGLDWTAAVLPVTIVEGVLLTHVGWILIQICRRGFALNVRQGMCLIGFTVSILTAIAAQGITVTRDYPLVPPPFHMTPAAVLNVPMIMWLFAGVVFTCSALAIVHQELDRIALSRGYTDPIPLSRSQAGWEPAKGYREASSVLLGVIRIRPPSAPFPPSAGQRGQTETPAAPGAIMLGDTGRNGLHPQPNGSSSSGSSVHPEEESSPVQGIPSVISNAAAVLHNAIYFFVLKTSLLPSVDSDSRTNILDIEMSSQYPLPVRTTSGELDGGDRDF